MGASRLGPAARNDLDAAHRLDAVERDHVRRGEEAVLHVRHQVGAAGDGHRVRAVLAEERHRLFNGAGTVVAEGGKSQHGASGAGPGAARP